VYELDGLGAAKYLIELSLYVTSVLVLFGFASLGLVGGCGVVWDGNLGGFRLGLCSFVLAKM
jgi:hypothetical protein